MVKSFVGETKVQAMTRMFFLLLCLAAGGSAHAQEFMTLGATKSTHLSGLLDYALPIFQAASNLNVHVVAIDRGQSVAIGERGDAEALLLADRPAEDKIVADGYGVIRSDAIYSDFVIVGPGSDPAGIRGVSDAGKAFALIAAKGALFASRGDDSGVNRRELRLWKSAGAAPNAATAWYRATKQDMEATLDLAATMNAYSLADRATWANFKNRKNLEVLTAGDPALFKVYGSIVISPDKWPQIKLTYARIWHGWLTDKHGSAAITSYKIDGEQIFFPCQGGAPATCRSASRE
jgi:tungstate transport system substrate-binding protein